MYNIFSDYSYSIVATVYNYFHEIIEAVNISDITSLFYNQECNKYKKRINELKKSAEYLEKEYSIRLENKKSFIRYELNDFKRVCDNVRNNFNKCESPIQKILYIFAWELFPDLEIEYEILQYRIDLAIPHKKIAIECDGFDWHNKKAQMNRDYERERNLKKLGWEVIRFTGSQIYTNPLNCVNDIIEIIEKKEISYQTKNQEKNICDWLENERD